jgi:hypothetical protein
VTNVISGAPAETGGNAGDGAGVEIGVGGVTGAGRRPRAMSASRAAWARQLGRWAAASAASLAGSSMYQGVGNIHHAGPATPANCVVRALGSWKLRCGASNRSTKLRARSDGSRRIDDEASGAQRSARRDA